MELDETAKETIINDNKQKIDKIDKIMKYKKRSKISNLIKASVNRT